jgi:hypothetical protein
VTSITSRQQATVDSEHVRFDELRVFYRFSRVLSLTQSKQNGINYLRIGLLRSKACEIQITMAQFGATVSVRSENAIRYPVTFHLSC